MFWSCTVWQSTTVFASGFSLNKTCLLKTEPLLLYSRPPKGGEKHVWVKITQPNTVHCGAPPWPHPLVLFGWFVVMCYSLRWTDKVGSSSADVHLLGHSLLGEGRSAFGARFNWSYDSHSSCGSCLNLTSALMQFAVVERANPLKDLCARWEAATALRDRRCRPERGGIAFIERDTKKWDLGLQVVER